MNIRIYQIDTDRPGGHEAVFLSLDRLERFTGSAAVNSALYKKVFDGDVACTDLEQVYEMFNLNHPDNYQGRSLSVSDVVEVVYSTVVPPGSYYCDRMGFQRIPFEPVKQAKETITVVLLEPGKQARVTDIEHSLEGMQAVVGGLIEPYSPLGDECCFIVSEEGKLDGLPLNRAVRDEDGEILDIIAGTAFICDGSGEDFASLSPEQQQRCLKQYKYPEHFFRVNNAIEAVPYRPREQER